MRRSWRKYWDRKGHIAKGMVEHRLSIDSSWLYDSRAVPFQEGEESFIHGYRIKAFASYILIRQNLYNNDFTLRVFIEKTPCHYGGYRNWFLCPHPKCQRRCKKLYLATPNVFLCRGCLNLGYFTQTRCELDRLIDKKWSLIRKLKASSDFIPDSQKPKRMHWKTFNLLRDQIADLEYQSTFGIAEKFGDYL